MADNKITKCPKKSRDNKLPNFRTAANPKRIRRGYLKLLYKTDSALIITLLCCIAPILLKLPFFLKKFCYSQQMLFEYSSGLFALYILAIALFAGVAIARHFAPKIYLAGFALYEGKDFMRLSAEKWGRVLELAGNSAESIAFEKRVSARNCIGESTMFPPNIMKDFPANISRQNVPDAMEEAEEVIFSCVEQVLRKTGLSPGDIDVLVLNCSLFCPTPSLSALVVNRFKMRENVKSFNLGGMGCSAGLIAVDLAKDVLKATSSRYALVVSTENITMNWYKGENRSMLIANTLFRLGGAAIILSSKRTKGALMELLHTVRTHKGRSDACFSCVAQEADEAGLVGVRLNKDIMQVAGKALKANITSLAPLTLPWAEQIKYLLNTTARMLLAKKTPPLARGQLRTILLRLTDLFLKLPESSSKPSSALKSSVLTVNAFVRRLCQLPAGQTAEGDRSSVGEGYIPDFTRAFDHFCIHAGGKSVIDAVGENLRLPEEKMAASREVLLKYGNTSSSSVWYELDHHIRRSSIKKGQKVWQIGFGSGFKCNSAVWKSLKNF